jgi:hypothetical protein
MAEEIAEALPDHVRARFLSRRTLDGCVVLTRGEAVLFGRLVEHVKEWRSVETAAVVTCLRTGVCPEEWEAEVAFHLAPLPRELPSADWYELRAGRCRPRTRSRSLGRRLLVLDVVDLSDRDGDVRAILEVEEL